MTDEDSRIKIKGRGNYARMIGQLKTYLVIEWEDANKTKIKKYRIYFEDQYVEAHKYWSTLKYPKSIELTVLENS